MWFLMSSRDLTLHHVTGWISSSNAQKTVLNHFFLYFQSSIRVTLFLTLQQEHPANQSPAGECWTLRQRH